MSTAIPANTKGKGGKRKGNVVVNPAQPQHSGNLNPPGADNSISWPAEYSTTSIFQYQQPQAYNITITPKSDLNYNNVQPSMQSLQSTPSLELEHVYNTVDKNDNNTHNYNINNHAGYHGNILTLEEQMQILDEQFDEGHNDFDMLTNFTAYNWTVAPTKASMCSVKVTQNNNSLPTQHPAVVMMGNVPQLTTIPAAATATTTKTTTTTTNTPAAPSSARTLHQLNLDLIDGFDNGDEIDETTNQTTNQNKQKYPNNTTTSPNGYQNTSNFHESPTAPQLQVDSTPDVSYYDNNNVNQISPQEPAALLYSIGSTNQKPHVFSNNHLIGDIPNNQYLNGMSSQYSQYQHNNNNQYLQHQQQFDLDIGDIGQVNNISVHITEDYNTAQNSRAFPQQQQHFPTTVPPGYDQTLSISGNRPYQPPPTYSETISFGQNPYTDPIVETNNTTIGVNNNNITLTPTQTQLNATKQATITTTSTQTNTIPNNPTTTNKSTFSSTLEPGLQLLTDYQILQMRLDEKSNIGIDQSDLLDWHVIHPHHLDPYTRPQVDALRYDLLYSNEILENPWSRRRVGLAVGFDNGLHSGSVLDHSVDWSATAVNTASGLAWWVFEQGKNGYHGLSLAATWAWGRYQERLAEQERLRLAESGGSSLDGSGGSEIRTDNGMTSIVWKTAGWLSPVAWYRYWTSGTELGTDPNGEINHDGLYDDLQDHQDAQHDQDLNQSGFFYGNGSQYEQHGEHHTSMFYGGYNNVSPSQRHSTSPASS